MKPEDILAQFNLEIKGFYNYYCIANNVSSTCADFGYIMEYSLYMTLGQKLRRHVGQIRDKYRKGKNFVIPYKDAKGKERFRTLYKEGFKRKSSLTDDFLDRTPCTHGNRISVDRDANAVGELDNGYIRCYGSCLITTFTICNERQTS